MREMEYLAYFAAGAFLANGIPHFVNGISGNYFQSPFARPPGVGESPPLVNVIWGLLNLVLGILLVMGVGEFEAGFTPHMLVLGIGFSAMALVLAWHFGRVRNENHGDQG
jgi:hypothetical protein